MQPFGLLTDDSAYFPRPYFSGRKLVHVLPGEFSDTATAEKQFAATLQGMLYQYQHVLAIFHGQAVSPLAQIAREYVENQRFSARVIVIDSGTFSLGLGILVQHAVHKILNTPHITLRDLALHVRRHTAEIYSLMVVSDLYLLEQKGFLRPSQRIIAQMLDFMPAFNVEKGHLALHEKIRSTRQLFNVLQDFLQEFEHIAYLGYFPYRWQTPVQTRAFRSFLDEHFSQAHIYPLVNDWAIKKGFGKTACGLIVMERVLS